MEILVIRHGQSQADLEDRHEGRADFPLTDLGKKQARLAAGWIKEHYPPEFILASSLKRAFSTAQIISEAVQAPLESEPLLMEWDNGKLAGLLREEAKKLYPLPEGGRKPHDTFADTESLIEFRARAETFWSKFFYRYIETQKYGRVALVAHGGIINMLFRSFLNLPLKTDITLATGDTGIHLWEISEKLKRRILFSNSLAHLHFQ